MKKCWLWFSCAITSLIYYMTLLLRIFLINRFSRFQFIDLTVLLWLRHMLLFSVFTRAGSSSDLIWAQLLNLPACMQIMEILVVRSTSTTSYNFSSNFVSLAFRNLILRASQDISGLHDNFSNIFWFLNKVTKFVLNSKC